MRSQKKYEKHTFSLIELLVVLIILTLTIGITGPFALEMVERNEKKAEELKLVQTCRRLGELAYTKNEEMTVNLLGRSLEVFNSRGESEYRVVFKKISFIESSFTISRTGFASVGSVVTVSGIQIPLNDGN